MNRLCLCAVFFFTICQSVTVLANDDDPFAEYQSDIRKEADAKVISVHEAWGNNMAEQIKSGYKDGIVIDEAGDYAGGKVRADGLGNVVVDKNAIVGPIINRTDVSNTTVILNPNRKRY